MTESNKSVAAPNAAESQNTQHTSSEAAQHTGDVTYEAPYYPYPENRVPDRYIVGFHDGYTLTEHFAFLGRDLELEGQLHSGYYATLDNETFKAIRRDPGVKFVQDDFLGEWERELSGEEESSEEPDEPAPALDAATPHPKVERR